MSELSVEGRSLLRRNQQSIGTAVGGGVAGPVSRDRAGRCGSQNSASKKPKTAQRIRRGIPHIRLVLAKSLIRARVSSLPPKDEYEVQYTDREAHTRTNFQWTRSLPVCPRRCVCPPEGLLQGKRRFFPPPSPSRLDPFRPPADHLSPRANTLCDTFARGERFA